MATKTLKSKTPLVRNVHHVNQPENKVTFTVSLVPPDQRFDHRELTLTQVGTTSTYILRERREFRDQRFLVVSDALKPEVVVIGKQIAWTVYKNRRALMLAEPHAYVLGETVETRPTGITDPKDQHYIACNLMVTKHVARQAGNCFYVSDSEVGRADDSPLTEDDLIALKAYPRGQVHIVVGNPGDKVAKVHCEVDSSD